MAGMQGYAACTRGMYNIIMPPHMLIMSRVAAEVFDASGHSNHSYAQ